MTNRPLDYTLDSDLMREIVFRNIDELSDKELVDELKERKYLYVGDDLHDMLEYHDDRDILEEIDYQHDVEAEEIHNYFSSMDIGCLEETLTELLDMIGHPEPGSRAWVIVEDVKKLRDLV